MPGHTHSLDTFSESTVSQSRFAGNARTHSQPGHIFREHCQLVQIGRKCQVTLTPWTHIQRALSASPDRQEMTHSLDTFSESTVSQSRFAENARTHSHSGHIFREHCQPVQIGRKCQDTHILDTFSESTVSQSRLAGNVRKHLQTGHIFREHCQPVQIGRKCQVTLTYWTHFQRPHCQPVQIGRKYQNTLTAWTHFQRALSASPDWQEMPGHTHSLDTFSESTVSQSRLAGNARTHSQPGHIFREHCQPVQIGVRHTHTLDTFSESTVRSRQAENARTHSHTGHIFREVSGVWQDTYSLNIFSANARYDVWNQMSTIYSRSIYNVSICFS